jgi:hypothetical protein
MVRMQTPWQLPMSYEIYASQPLKIKVTKNTKPCLVPTSDEVQSTGGPREGKGGAVATAICAAAMGCSAWANAEGFTNAMPLDDGGKATNRHMAQSGIVCSWLSALLLSLDTSFITPPAVHTISMALGDTKDEADATPSDMTNHTSMKRANDLACLSECICQF